MWEWLMHNSVWILITFGLLVLIMLFFNERLMKLIKRLEPERWQGRTFAGITAVFWYLEGIAVIIVILAFVALVFSEDEGVAAMFTPDAIRNWFSEHGISNVIILIVGGVLWVIVKQGVPVLVQRVLTRPKKGESREGIKKRADTLQGVFMGIARVLILLMVCLVILSEYVAIGPILAGFGVAGIAVGFGAQYLIRDLIAGIFVLIENQYRVGDVAKVANIIGLVEEINMRKTVLRDLDGVVHHVPNGEITVASNYSRHFSRVNLNISVSYGTDLDYAIGVINRVCQDMADDPAWQPVIRSVPKVLRVDNLGDSGIDIKIVGDVKPLEQWSAMGELRLRLKREFDKVGIEIPWPHTKVYFGNMPGDEQVVQPVRVSRKKTGRKPGREPDDHLSSDMGDD